MLIYSVDGFIADREGAFGWSAPSEEQFGFHLAQVGELGGYLCGRRLYETMLVWETDRSLRDTELGAAFADVWGAIPKVVFSHTLDSVQGTVGIRPHLDRDPWKSGPMAVIERLDFLGVPTQDPERSRAFYRDVLGLRPDEHADWEQWAGDTCFAIWEPEKQGMPFVAQKGNPWPLRCDDVAKMRAALEAKGVQFSGDTFDTGVCHMAIFADPDGNELMLHRRYAPYE